MIRPPWVPDDIDDELIDAYAATIGGHLARAEHEARQLGPAGASIIAEIDQTRAVMREGAMRVLRDHFAGFAPRVIADANAYLTTPFPAEQAIAALYGVGVEDARRITRREDSP